MEPHCKDMHLWVEQQSVQSVRYTPVKPAKSSLLKPHRHNRGHVVLMHGQKKCKVTANNNNFHDGDLSTRVFSPLVFVLKTF